MHNDLMIHLLRANEAEIARRAERQGVLRAQLRELRRRIKPSPHAVGPAAAIVPLWRRGSPVRGS
jgi:hypothetical protein